MIPIPEKILSSGQYFRCILVMLLFLPFFSLKADTVWMADSLKRSSDRIPATWLAGKDSVYNNPVFLLQNTPDDYHYNAVVRTPVCSDTLCQVVQLSIFWDLAGNFLRFDTLPGYPLTKNDHKPFTAGDYAKLYDVLSDEQSILGRKTENELLDSTMERYSSKIDAVTGATALEIRKAVVEGALYSTYTLWHLVNGSVGESLRTYTLGNLTPEMEKQMINSNNPKTQIFILKQWEDGDYEEKFSEICSIMAEGHPLVNFFIAKRIPTSVFSNDINLRALKDLWEHLDLNTKSILAPHLK